MRSLAVYIIIWLSIIARAQDQFDLNVANVDLLKVKGVMKDLHVSKRQIAAMNRAVNRYSIARDAGMRRSNFLRTNVDATEVSTALATLRNDTLSEFTAPQLRRLRELTLQKAGAIAIGEPIVAYRLGLSDSQYSTAKLICQEARARENELFRAAIDPITISANNTPKHNAADVARVSNLHDRRMKKAIAQLSPKLSAIHATTSKRLLAILSPRQVSEWKALCGKPYNGQ